MRAAVDIVGELLGRTSNWVGRGNGPQRTLADRSFFRFFELFKDPFEGFAQPR